MAMGTGSAIAGAISGLNRRIIVAAMVGAVIGWAVAILIGNADAPMAFAESAAFGAFFGAPVGVIVGALVGVNYAKWRGLR